MKKYNGWQNFPTIQFKEIISELVDAKDEQKSLMLIAPTGLGKSNAIKQFSVKNPKHTYIITLGDSYNLPVLLNDVCTSIGVSGFTLSSRDYKYFMLKKISARLIEIANDGGRPVLIFDEDRKSVV